MEGRNLFSRKQLGHFRRSGWGKESGSQEKGGRTLSTDTTDTHVNPYRKQKVRMMRQLELGHVQRQTLFLHISGTLQQNQGFWGRLFFLCHLVCTRSREKRKKDTFKHIETKQANAGREIGQSTKDRRCAKDTRHRSSHTELGTLTENTRKTHNQN